MNNPLTDRNYISSLILVLVAGSLLVVITITDRKDITSASVVVSSMVLFLTGILIFTFAKKESVDGNISTLIPVQNQINICRMAADLGVMGNAWFLPGDRTGTSSIMQFIPVSTYDGGKLEGNSFVSGPGGTGVLLPPAGETLKTYLRERSDLVIPDTMEEVLILIKETGEELLGVTNNVKALKAGTGVSISLSNYLLIEGCRKVTSESPGCCLLNPCAICSLFGMIISEGLNQPVMIERCRPYKQEARVDILFSLPL
jgi:hypothetical protein